MGLPGAKAADLIRLLMTGHGGRVRRAVANRLHSNSTLLGLRRDLSIPFEAPSAKIPIDVRPLRPGDDLSFLSLDGLGISRQEAVFRLKLRRLLEAQIPTCYVAIAPEGRPCYMQWLIGGQPKTVALNLLFGTCLPILSGDEMLLEGAYTVDAYRGKGVMASAMARIAEEAKQVGGRRVITFVGEANVASLKGCRKAGFAPFVRRDEAIRLFRRRVTYSPLPEGSALSFECERAIRVPA